MCSFERRLVKGKIRKIGFRGKVEINGKLNVQTIDFKIVGNITSFTEFLLRNHYILLQNQ